MSNYGYTGNKDTHKYNTYYLLIYIFLQSIFLFSTCILMGMYTHTERIYQSVKPHSQKYCLTVRRSL